MILVPLREPKGSVERKQGEKSQIKHRRVRSAMGCLGLSPGSPLRCPLVTVARALTTVCTQWYGPDRQEPEAKQLSLAAL